MWRRTRAICWIRIHARYCASSAGEPNASSTLVGHPLAVHEAAEVVMHVRQAKAIARQWVIEAASTAPGFAGAFYHGSTNWLPDDAMLPAASDLDVMVVLDTPDPPVKP